MHENSTNAEKVYDMENGLSLWKVHLDVLREQDVNARVMSDTKFTSLVNNIKNDKRLESLPLCTWETNKSGNRQLGIISGHHRTRAARAASVMIIFVLVFESTLDSNSVKAKQLAHNAINGTDDSAKLKEIYDSIDDIRSKIESAITQDELNYSVGQVKTEDLSISMDFEMLNICFFPNQKAEFETVLDLMDKDQTGDNVLVSELAAFDKFKKAAKKVSKSENIRNISAILYRMIKIVRAHYEAIEKAQKESAQNVNAVS